MIGVEHNVISTIDSEFVGFDELCLKYVLIVRNVIAERGVNSLILLGASMGGAFAHTVYRHMPHVVKAMVLIDPISPSLNRWRIGHEDHVRLLGAATLLSQHSRLPIPECRQRLSGDVDQRFEEELAHLGFPESSLRCRRRLDAWEQCATIVTSSWGKASDATPDAPTLLVLASRRDEFFGEEDEMPPERFFGATRVAIVDGTHFDVLQKCTASDLQWGHLRWF